MTDNKMTTELAFESMEKLLPHLSAVINDADVQGIMEGLKTEEGKNQPVGDLMMTLLPLFVGKHRDSMFEIVAALKGCTVEDVKQMDFAETVAVMRNNFLGDMLHFFICCLRMVNVR